MIKWQTFIHHVWNDNRKNPATCVTITIHGTMNCYLKLKRLKVMGLRHADSEIVLDEVIHVMVVSFLCVFHFFGCIDQLTESCFVNGKYSLRSCSIKWESQDRRSVEFPLWTVLRQVSRATLPHLKTQLIQSLTGSLFTERLDVFNYIWRSLYRRNRLMWQAIFHRMRHDEGWKNSESYTNLRKQQKTMRHLIHIGQATASYVLIRHYTALINACEQPICSADISI